MERRRRPVKRVERGKRVERADAAGAPLGEAGEQVDGIGDEVGRQEVEGRPDVGIVEGLDGGGDDSVERSGM